MQDPIIINPPQAAKYTVIWLHGLGADGYDFAPLAPQFQNSVSSPVRFIFPHAPLRPVTLNGGYVMRAWYDITGLDITSREDRSGLDQTAEYLDKLIQEQQKDGISTEHVLLGGFSQGCAASLYMGLRYTKPLGGIIGLSGYLPFYQTLGQEAQSTNQKTPLFLAHGVSDPVVPFAWAELSRKVLQELNYQVSWHSYPMAHQVCLEETQDLAKWIKRIIG